MEMMVRGTICLLAFGAMAAPAQTLEGRVLDISGAVVPRAEVILTAANGQRTEAVVSGADGGYKVAGLAAGRYNVEVRQPGFAPLRQAVQVDAANQAPVNLTLLMGRISETVTVVGQRKPTPADTSRTPQRIRVGGNVQASRLLDMPKPQYPQQLQDAGIEGVVLLEGVIAREGNLLSLHSLNSLVHADLTRAAMDAVRNWRYQPTLLNGQPVEVITTITVNFKLAP
ncbi:MAG: TonB family protein [Candidatus Solibacter usitatus]|nr:TonB family protein [Candidatus Solibacter usitatus]